MDGSEFDALSRVYATQPSRRSLAWRLGGLVLGGTLALQGLTDSAAKKKGKKRPKKRRANSPPGCTPNCFDRVCGPDGCGGSCGTCPLVGQRCERGACACPPDQKEVCGGACLGTCLPGTVRHRETCRCCIPSGQPSGGASESCCSGAAVRGTCQGFTYSACTFDEQCTSGNCLAGACEYCPKGQDYCVGGTSTQECVGNATDGHFYICLTTVGNATRCGRKSGNVACNGCSSDVDCVVELGQGSGAFCVRDTGAGCDCPNGQTFCALPRPQS